MMGVKKQMLIVLLLSAGAFLATAQPKPIRNNVAVKLATSTVDAFEKVFGVTKGKRRNHTKGFCFSAELVPLDSEIQAYSNSPLFQHPSKVIGRLSHKGGNPEAADHTPAEYGMGLSISNQFAGTHIMAMNTLDFFPVSTPEDFAELMKAKAIGKPAVKAFLKRSAEMQRFKAHAGKKDKTLLAYEGSTYNSLNSFYLVNEQGEKTAVRWSFEPAGKRQIVVEPKQDFFFENLQQNLQQGEVAWNMRVIFASPNDDINNAAIPWSKENKNVLAAKLMVKDISSEQNGRCHDINFDPLTLSQGFAASDDPILHARRPSYAVSFGRRMAEKN